MGPKTRELVETVDELRELLVGADEQHWAKWMEDCEKRLRDGMFSGVERLLGAYGGMGSFLDLWITCANGHSVAADREVEVNEKLAELRSRAYTLADEIKKEAVFE